jgi:hypothetical protein
MVDSTFTEGAKSLAFAARYLVDTSGCSSEHALNLVTDFALQDSYDESRREGRFADAPVRGLDASDVFIAGAVASDVADGLRTRPGIGNVRQFVLALI